MGFPADMDDPCDRPEFYDGCRREIGEYAEESIRRLDELANEKADAMESF